MEIPVHRPFEVHYLKSGDGHILCTHFKADDNDKGTLIFLPSVAEEMNRCRVMVSMQARCFADMGYGVVLVDYFGTGDSQGNFGETDWNIWKANVRDVCDWVEQKGLTVFGLWGLRMGALLAVEMAHDYPGRFKKLLLWQPVINGETYFTQLLRMRMAGQMDRSEVIEKPDALRARIATGEAIEIGGYLFNPQLAAQLDEKKMAAFSVKPELSVDWFEAVRGPDADFSVATQKIVQGWQQEGVDLQMHGFVGNAFWQMPERALAPELIESSTRALQP